MSIGKITWDIKNGVVASTAINGVMENGVMINKPFKKLITLFNSLPIPDIQDCKVSAWLHIQDGKDFFHLRDIGAEAGSRLSPAFSFCQEKLFYQKEKNLPTSGNADEPNFLLILHLAHSGDDNNSIFFPRYSSVMDSSVWNYYLCVSDTELNEHAAWIVKNIACNKINGIYELAISKEYADLNARLVCDSYIASESKGHGSDISPFLFHSEWKMEKQYKLDKVKKYSWRFLLIDDYAWRSMDKNDESNDPNESVITTKVYKNSKLDILSRTIESMGFKVRLVIKSVDENGNSLVVDKNGQSFSDEEKTNEGAPIIEIWGVDSIKEAFTAFDKKRKFDIILLDYLLGKHSIHDTLGENYHYYHSGREYGYQFLKRLKDADSYDDIPKIEDGPVGKQYFMFISAFTTAVGERLRTESLLRSEEKWYIAEGACPTNTPSLFRYYLSRVMEDRLEQTCIDGLSYDSIGLSYDSILNNLERIFETNLIGNSQDKRDQRIKSVREKAYDKYNDILGLHYDYFELKKDEDKSLLVNSFLRDKDHMDALLEHLLQFIHLIAFGTVRQWPEIWEEYQFVVRTLNISHDDNENNRKVRRVSRLIEKHIIDLKSA